MLKPWNAVSTLDRMFDDVMGSALGAATNPRGFEPDFDIRVSESEVLVVCDLPGLKRDDIDVVLENHVLTIRGKRKFEAKENERVILGRTYGAFMRQFKLPDSLDEDNLLASLVDGVLTVTIPRQAVSQPIKIQVGGSEPKRLKE